MKPINNENPLYWLSRIHGAVAQFKEQPNAATRAALLAEAHNFQKLVDEGLVIPTKVPEPTTRTSRTYSEWLHLQTDEASLMFGLSPTKERLEGLIQILDRYADDLAKGRVKP